MKPAQVFIMLILIDLFLYYGAGAMGALPDTAENRVFSAFGDVEAETASNQTGSLVNQNAVSDEGLIPGTNMITNFLGGAANLINWGWSVMTMPFAIGGIVGLSGPAMMIPAVVYAALVVFALAQILTGREM